MSAMQSCYNDGWNIHISIKQHWINSTIYTANNRYITGLQQRTGCINI